MMNSMIKENRCNIQGVREKYLCNGSDHDTEESSQKNSWNGMTGC